MNNSVAAALLLGLLLAACGGTGGTGGTGGSVAPEAGTAPRDAESAPPDTGPPIPDGGPSPSEVGSGRADASSDAVSAFDHGVTQDAAPLPPDAFVGTIDTCAVEGCPSVDRRARPCTAAADCSAGQGCPAAGACGLCALDTDCRPNERCSVGLCLPPTPPLWRLHVLPVDLQTIVADPYTEIFVPCTLDVDDTTYAQGCRVRLKGGTSRDFPKKSFRIDFDGGVPHPGRDRKINLRAEYNDPSFLRNFLTAESMRRLSVVPTPAVQFVRLYMNDEYYGLMTEVENIDSTFLETQGLSGDGPTYESDPTLPLTQAGAGGLVPLPDPALYPQAYAQKAGPNGDFGPLMDLIERVLWRDWLDEMAGRAPAARVRATVDVGEYLDYLAVLGLVQEQDHVRKNFYLTRQPTAEGPDLWMVVPWDLDMSFGCLWDEAAQNTICDSTVVDQAFDRGTLLAGEAAGYPEQYYYNQLIQQVLADGRLRSAFTTRLCADLASPYWQVDLPSLVDTLGTYLRPSVEADLADLNVNPGDFDAALVELRRFIAERTDDLRSAVPCP